MTRRYTIFRLFMNVMGRLLFGFTVHGAEKVPRVGPVILASNHHQYADPVLVCMAVPRRIWWMAKKEVFRGPVLKRFFHFIGSFPVDRAGGGRAAIKTSLALLKSGWALGLFPEGTRRRGGYSAEAAKSGVVMIALRSGAPVVPIHIGKMPSPLGRFLRGERLVVHVGDPISLDAYRADRRYGEAADELMRGIYALPKEARSGGGPAGG